MLDANLYSDCKLFCIKDGCIGYSRDSEKEIFSKFEYERIHLIKSNGPELARIPDRLILHQLVTNYCIDYAKNSYNSPIEIASTSENGEKFWSDAKYRSLIIPPLLRGSIHLKSHNSERFSVDPGYLIIRSALRVKVYVLWPNRNRRPKWLYELFHITPAVVDIKPAVFSLEVWESEKFLSPGEYITLGGSEADKGARDMTSYVVVAKTCGKVVLTI